MKKILFFSALAILMASCVKTPEPTRFSVLGDSFSTYKGYVDPETNDVFPYDTLGFSNAGQMWWAQVADSLRWKMERNNSFSGSLVCNFDGFAAGNYYAPESFVRRMDNLGHPDVIFIFGGTNDIYQGAPLGDYVYSDWTEEQLCTFRPAMAYILETLRQQHPTAKVYFLVDMELCIDDTSIDDEIRQAYIESMHQIANHYDVVCVDIYGIRKSMWHPNVEGQAGIARQLLEVISADFNV